MHEHPKQPPIFFEIDKLGSVVTAFCHMHSIQFIVLYFNSAIVSLMSTGGGIGLWRRLLGLNVSYGRPYWSFMDLGL